jgi:hypothetical protein
MNEHIGFTLRDGLDLTGVDVTEVWWRYAALGGASDLPVLIERLAGATPSTPMEHDLIAQALNETFLDQGIETFPVSYSDPLPPRIPLPVRSTRAGTHTSPAAARRDAAVARLRGAAAARRAAVLHATAAELLQSSGHLQFARHARARARVAQQRSVAQSVA